MPHGVFTVDEAAKVGYSRQQLAQWVSTGILNRVACGIYARVDEPISPTFEMEVLAKRGTDFVVALESALRVQDFSTATPHALWIAIGQGVKTPAVPFPLSVVRVTDAALRFGVEEREFNGTRVRVYSAAKTVADLFKFRNKVGLEIALEALKEGLRQNRFNADELMKAARVDRVANVILPYLEACFT